MGGWVCRLEAGEEDDLRLVPETGPEIPANRQRLLGMRYTLSYLQLVRKPGIDFKESIPPAYVARRAGTATLFLLGS